jgi:hypothetical protein
MSQIIWQLISTAGKEREPTQTVYCPSEQTMCQDVGTFVYPLCHCCMQLCRTCSKSSQWQVAPPTPLTLYAAATDKPNFKAEWVIFLLYNGAGGGDGGVPAVKSRPGDQQICLRPWRMPSSGMLRRVTLVRTDVSEEPSASFIRVTRIGELGTTLAVTSNRHTLRRNTKWRRKLEWNSELWIPLG